MIRDYVVSKYQNGKNDSSNFMKALLEEERSLLLELDSLNTRRAKINARIAEIGQLKQSQ